MPRFGSASARFTQRTAATPKGDEVHERVSGNEYPEHGRNTPLGGACHRGPWWTFLNRDRGRLERFEPRQIRGTVNPGFFEAARYAGPAPGQIRGPESATAKRPQG